MILITRAFCLTAAAASLAVASPIAAAAGSNGGDRVDQICAGGGGLAPGEKHFAACEQSLSDSVRNLREGEGYASARRGCLDRGYRPNTAGLAQCELAAKPTSDP